MILEQLLIKKASAYNERVLAYFDFEYKGQTPDSLNFSEEIVRSGSYSYLMNKDHEFIPVIEMPIKDLNTTEGARISASIFHHFNSAPQENPPLLVLSLQNNWKIYFYQAWEIRPLMLYEWEESSFEHALPEWKSPDDILKVYIWNKGRQQFYIDDLTISLKEPF